MKPVARSRFERRVTGALNQALIKVPQALAIGWDLCTFRLRRWPVPPVACLWTPPRGIAVDWLAIFVIVADSLDESHLCVINALTAAGYQIAVANNKGFCQLGTVPKSVAFVIESQNAGRDIGRYIRALHFIDSHDILAYEARILFLNDPVIVLPGVPG